MPRLVPAAGLRPIQVRVDDRPPFWWLRWLPAFVLALAFLYVTYVVGQVAIVPLLASFGIAYILNPITESIEKRGFSRAIAAFLSLVIVAMLILGFAWFVIPDLWEQAVNASQIILNNLNEENARNIRAEIRKLSPFLDSVIGYRVYRFIRSPNVLVQESNSWFAGHATDFLATAANALDLLLIPFFVFYILVDFSAWRISFDELIPPRFREPFSRLLDEVGRILQSYVLGQLMIATIMAALYAVGFVAMGVPAWAGIAALSGFLNLIPYVGTLSGMVLASGFTFASGGGIWRVAGVIGVFAAVQSVEGYILTPRILGGRLSLHPMAVFLGLLIGGRLFGFLGVLLAVPVIAVAQVFAKFMREIWKASEFYHAGDVGPEPQPVGAEEVIAKAADTVLADQVEKQEGTEVLAPSRAEDDAVARRPEP